MSKKAFVQRVATITGTGKRLYRDSIMDAGFVGHFDFKSDYVRNGNAASLAAGATVKNLVDGGVAGVTSTAFASGFGAKGLISSTGAGRIKLPDTFKLAANETHFAFCVWAGVDLSLGAFPAEALTISIGGHSYQLNAYNQYSLSLHTDPAGVPSLLRGYADGGSLNFPAASLASVLDGKLHQMIIEFEVISSVQKRLTAYFDGVQVAQAVMAYDGSLNDPSSQADVGPFLGRLGGFSAHGFRGYYGRAWLKRFATDPTATPVATIAAAEWAKYKDRFLA